MAELKPITKSLYNKMAYDWIGEKAIVLFDQKNLGGEIIKEGEEVEITGRKKSDRALNIKNKEGVEIYGVSHEYLSHKK